MGKTPINDLLAANLAEYMREQKLTQSALAQKCGVDQKTISNYLTPSNRLVGKSGKPPSAKLSEVEKIADALGVDVWELVSPLTYAQKQFYRGLEAMVLETTRWPTVTGGILGAAKQVLGEGQDFPKAPPPNGQHQRKPKP